jgi:dihydroflavonol-4-reductase
LLTLVTGATGLVGNNVVRRLLHEGQRVRVLQRTTSDPRPLAGLDVERAEGDIRQPEAVLAACRGVDRVVHAAAHVHIGWSGLKTHRAINVEGTRNVARATRAAGAKLVHVSSVDALGRGSRERPADEESVQHIRMHCPYVLTKRAAEAVVLEEVERGLEAVIVNPVYMLGPWDWRPSSGRMLLHVARGKAMITPRGGNDFCDVRDVVGGLLAAAERGQCGRRYILGGEPLSYLEAWRMMAEVVGVRRPRSKAGPMQMLAAGWIGDFWYQVSGREPDLNSAAVVISSEHHHYSYRRATEELGYRPCSARSAAEAAWSWFREHGYASQMPAVMR